MTKQFAPHAAMRIGKYVVEEWVHCEHGMREVRRYLVCGDQQIDITGLPLDAVLQVVEKQ